jgi:hypothetical protein
LAKTGKAPGGPRGCSFPKDRRAVWSAESGRIRGKDRATVPPPSFRVPSSGFRRRGLYQGLLVHRHSTVDQFHCAPPVAPPPFRIAPCSSGFVAIVRFLPRVDVYLGERCSEPRVDRRFCQRRGPSPRGTPPRSAQVDRVRGRPDGRPAVSTRFHSPAFSESSANSQLWIVSVTAFSRSSLIRSR